MSTLFSQQDLQTNVNAALHEDLGNAGDITASLIPEDALAEAQLLLRERAVIAGRPWFDAVFAQVDPAISINWLVEEGSKQAADTIICTIHGNARNLLTAERSALNFLQTLSGTATTTHLYANALAGTKTRILDTRKTLPGLRLAQKYAVACGGGKNHRIGLYDMVLIKENHIMAAGSITAAVQRARELYPDLKIEVETENLDEFREALASSVNIIMLDNYNYAQMREAVALNTGAKQLEVSGNVTLKQLPEIAATGVDFISSGALTKDLKSIDFSMRFQTK